MKPETIFVPMIPASPLPELKPGDFRSLARAISLVENDYPGASDWLASLGPNQQVPVIGITGPPGAGKSTLVNALISHFAQQGLRVGVIAIDPTSPFNLGSLLGDRIRMAEHYTNPNIFIRSLATRGSLGGLSAKAIEVTDVMKAFGFDLIIIETVGVGQSEVEIAGLADVTVVVLVPEAGDDIQGLKSGIMEIADIFIVNKADRPGAEEFMSRLRRILTQRPHESWQIPVIGTVASEKKGIEEVAASIKEYLSGSHHQLRRPHLLAEKAWQLIQHHRMKQLSKKELAEEISRQMATGNFNLYKFVEDLR